MAANDNYRDTAFQGGLANSEFGPGYLGATAFGNTLNPLIEHRRDPTALAGTLPGHLTGVASFQAAALADTLTGGDLAYDEAYWQERNPGRLLDRIVVNDISVFLVGGWRDLFQRGAPLNYSGLQNAAAGRPTWAPMSPDQPISGRYQLMMGPWYHNNAGAGSTSTGSNWRGSTTGSKARRPASLIRPPRSTPTTWALSGGSTRPATRSRAPRPPRSSSATEER